MKCPYCKLKNTDSGLKQYRLESAVIDLCPQCKGLWFDANEMKPAIEELTPAFEQKNLKELIDRDAKGYYQVKEQVKICPKCNIQMQGFNYAYDSNIFLDRCPNCQGVWADSGEFKVVVQYKKGHPKIDKLVQSMIEHTEEIGLQRDNLESARGVMRYGGVWGRMGLAPLPVGDENPVSILPAITILVIAINTILYIITAQQVKSIDFLKTYGLVPSHLTLTTLFSSIFLHGDILHLLGNMFFFWIFGDNLEEAMGRIKFILFYLFCGVVAGLVHTMSTAHSHIPAIGASGAISGIMGGYLVLYPKVRIKTFWLGQVFRIPAVVFLGLWSILQLIYATTSYSGVAWYAHIGGFLAGAITIYLLKKTNLILTNKRENLTHSNE